MKKLFIFISAFLILGIYSTAKAQIDVNSFISQGQITPDQLAEELNISLQPKYPNPNEKVSLSISMYSEDINSAEISFYKDGVLQTKGIGLKNFSFTAPNAGGNTVIRISVRLKDANKPTFSKSITISPAGVEILWQADSYTPPFYRGKAMMAPQGNIKFIAFAQFGNTSSSIIAPSTLLYKWSINGEVNNELSGYGRNTANIKGSLLGKPTQVTVLVTDPSTNTSAQGNIVIKPEDPIIVFYENSPLYGIIFERAIVNSISLRTDEMNIIGVPYNVSSQDLDNLNYKWRINGVEASGVNSRSSTFRRPVGIAGSSNISMSFENNMHLLQSAEGKFSINFEEENEIN